MQLRSLTSFVQFFPTPEDANIIYDFVCPTPGGQVPENIDMALNSAQIPPDLDNPVCDNEFLNDALMQARNMIQTFYNLTNHEQFCRYSTSPINVLQLL